MTATEDKFNTLLTKMDAKMDALLKVKADQEVKLNSILQNYFRRRPPMTLKI